MEQTTTYKLAEEDSELGRKVKETLEILEQVVQKYGCVLDTGGGIYTRYTKRYGVCVAVQYM